MDIATESEQAWQLVADIAATVASSLDTREIYRLVVQQLNEHFRVETGSLLRIDEATGELAFVMTLEAGAERLTGQTVPRGRGIAGAVILSQQPVIANDAAKDPRFYPNVSRAMGYEVRNLLCAPLVVKGRSLGVVQLINKHDGAFTPDDARRLVAMCSIIAVALENARLFELERDHRQLLLDIIASIEGGFLDTTRGLQALNKAIDTQERAVRNFFNPYIAGVPLIQPELFFGRQRLLDRVLSVLHNNSLLIYGERRIGKTSFLYQLRRLVAANQDDTYSFVPVYVDLQGVDESVFFRTLVEAIVEACRVRVAVLPALRLQSNYEGYGFPDVRRDLGTLIGALQSARNDAKMVKLVLLLDEIDILQAYDERVQRQLRSLFMQHYSPQLSAVVAGVSAQQRWRSYTSPFYNLFHAIELPPLDDNDMRALICQPVAGQYSYDDDAVEHIVALALGRPMRAQQLCMEAINLICEQARVTVTIADTLAAADRLGPP
ncbi:MAG: GAF domain-containing protein [Chloroflexales bacterium]|nr:GAF domain-containing protein [Chloroflexales bacterium]